MSINFVEKACIINDRKASCKDNRDEPTNEYTNHKSKLTEPNGKCMISKYNAYVHMRAYKNRTKLKSEDGSSFIYVCIVSTTYLSLCGSVIQICHFTRIPSAYTHTHSLARIYTKSHIQIHAKRAISFLPFQMSTLPLLSSLTLFVESTTRFNGT